MVFQPSMIIRIIAGLGLLCLADAGGCAEREKPDPAPAAAVPQAAARQRDGKPVDVKPDAAVALAEPAAEDQPASPSVSVREGEDWPEFLGPRKTGVSGERDLLKKWPEKGPPVVWKKRIGTGYSAPSVRGVLRSRMQSRKCWHSARRGSASLTAIISASALTAVGMWLRQATLWG